MSETAAHDPAGRALISVFNKDGLLPLGEGLAEANWEIVSSGGTADAFLEAGIPVTKVEDITHWPSMLSGRVKTLHPLIHGGLLADMENPDHMNTLTEKGILRFDMARIDMYPLEEAIANPSNSLADVIEKMDVGGPTMLNAAVKGNRLVLSAAEQQEEFLERLKAGTLDDLDYRAALRHRAIYETTRYYMPLMHYLGGTAYSGFVAKQHAPTKYGENPQQTPAALYADNRINADPLGLDQFTHVKGWEQSFINTTDMDSLLTTSTHIAAGFERNFGSVPQMAVGVKHGNACGAGVAETMVGAVEKMLDGDTRAIFGGVIMINGIIDKDVAETLMHYAMDTDTPRLLDGVVGSGVTDEALEILSRKKLRVVINPALATLTESSLDLSRRQRPVRGGVLEQPQNPYVHDFASEDVHVYGEVNERQKQDMVLAWAIGSTSNSNTITIVKDGKLLGNGVGQQDRVGAGQLALSRTTIELPGIADISDEGLFLDENGSGEIAMIIRLDKNKLYNAVAYSDSFFPFPDGPQLLVDAGIKSILSSYNTDGHIAMLQPLFGQGVNVVLISDKKARGFARH